MASTAAPFAFAVPVQLLIGVGTPTQFLLCVSVVVGDSVNAPLEFNLQVCYDASQPFATNVANIKTAIVGFAGAEFGITLLSSQVSVLVAVD